MDRSPRIAVLGAGVVGLSTALCLQNSLPYAKIFIYADKFGNDTLSSGAGALFRPEISAHPDGERLLKWYKDSLQHFLEIIKSSDASEAGMQLVSGFQLSSNGSESLKNPLLISLLPVCRDMSAKELENFPAQYKWGLCYTTVHTDCSYYLQWMKSKFEQGGGTVILKHISHLSEIPEDFDVIVNCTGLDAKHLVKDNMLVPIRGQTIKVKAPWIKHFYYGDEVYVVPGLDYVTLGGVKDYGSWNKKVNLYQKDWIWDKSTELIPSLKNAKIICDWVGLRPYRSTVRVDATLISFEGRVRKVVNNYGHGGHGVSLSWGTAQEATKLVQEILLQYKFSVAKL